jgi:hypothetical protein
MSEGVQKPDRQRWGRVQWGTATFLAYLWSWLILWGLAMFGSLPESSTLSRIAYVVYWPLVKISDWVRLHR